MSPGKTTSLIVDDEPDMCWVLHHVLTKKGFDALVALTAREALDLMVSSGFPLVFLDAKLPDMEGLDLAKQIRLLHPGTCIVMISGYFYKDDASVQKALESGLISGFMSKPFQNDEVLGIMETLNGA